MFVQGPIAILHKFLFLFSLLLNTQPWLACLHQLLCFSCFVWLCVLMKTLPPERHPAACQTYGIYRFSSRYVKQELRFNWPTNTSAKGDFSQVSLCHSTGIYWAPQAVGTVLVSEYKGEWNWCAESLPGWWRDPMGETVANKSLIAPCVKWG